MTNTVDDVFYRAFEDEYRGSRELILSRLRAYLPFIEPMRALSEQPSAVDLGCGRGEWLELLGSIGYRAIGVDINESMLQACRERHLDVRTGDALEFIRSLEDSSQLIVSAFHVVEHIPFATLREIVAQADRVLKPGGLLVLETPNPENLTVATTSFYLDPTHNRPIPPELLRFVVRYQGFERTKIVRLQERMPLESMPRVKAADLLAGVSPDYSVVAQKKGDPALLDATASAFSTKFGREPADLVRCFDTHGDALAQQVFEAGARLSGVETAARQAEARMSELEARTAGA